MKQKWLEKNGFNKQGITYCVAGDDTYTIKDELKRRGYKYNKILGWHAGDCLVELPIGYKHIPIKFENVCDWSDIENDAGYLASAEDFVKKRISQDFPPSPSNYIGQIGERIYNKTAIYKSKRGFAGKFGWTNILEFRIGDDILTWFTTKDDFDNIEFGSPVNITFTVKKHEEFREKKTTVITRAIVKTIETDIEVVE